MSTFDKVPLLLDDAVLSLYPQDSSGAAVTSNPVWFGACAENLRIVEDWIGVETRPGGRSHPHRRAFAPQYTIDISRVWLMQKGDLDDFQPERGPYVIDITWEDQDGYWQRKTFYNVTPISRSLNGDDPEAAMREGQSWAAETVVNSSGQVGVSEPPPIVTTFPVTVHWVGNDGTYQIYGHAADTGLFTESSPGISAGRATLRYVPDTSGKFEVDIQGVVRLRVTAARVLEVGRIITGSPGPSDIPRVEFRDGGGQRIAAVDDKGKFYAFNFNEGSVPSPAAFHIYAGGSIGMALSSARASVATAIQEVL